MNSPKTHNDKAFGSHAQCPSDNIPCSVSDHNRQLLVDYLGVESTVALASACDEQMLESVLEKAKAATFANSFGRHRGNFARPPTPEGFWRTEMPSTQDLEADRGRAQEVQRREVEQRQREAKKIGGIWLFRDE